MSDERKPLAMSRLLKDRTARALFKGSCWADSLCRKTVAKVYPMIRDYVLEEAAKACLRFADEQMVESQRRGLSRDYRRQELAECHANGAANCFSRIRAMKGKQP